MNTNKHARSSIRDTAMLRFVLETFALVASSYRILPISTDMSLARTDLSELQAKHCCAANLYRKKSRSMIIETYIIAVTIAVSNRDHCQRNYYRVVAILQNTSDPLHSQIRNDAIFCSFIKRFFMYAYQHLRTPPPHTHTYTRANT